MHQVYFSREHIKELARQDRIKSACFIGMMSVSGKNLNEVVSLVDAADYFMLTEEINYQYFNVTMVTNGIHFGLMIELGDLPQRLIDAGEELVHAPAEYKQSICEAYAKLYKAPTIKV